MFWKLLSTLVFTTISLVAQEKTIKLGIVSMFKNSAPYLKEWIVYHHMAGVDHFWLYNDKSSDNWEEVLKPYIESGLVEVLPAIDSWHSDGWWGYRQRLSFKDGVKRAAAKKAEWVALIDQDEFILPMEESTIPECLDKHFEEASAVYLNWRHFGTGGISLQEGESQLFNLTACSPRTHVRNRVGKSIVRPAQVSNESFHSVHWFSLKQGSYFDGNGSPHKKVIKRTWDIYDKYLRINHYIFRDENFYRNVRVPRDQKSGRSSQAADWYRAFSLEQDFAIIDFIKSKHPETFEIYWARSS